MNYKLRGTTVIDYPLSHNGQNKVRRALSMSLVCLLLSCFAGNAQPRSATQVKDLRVEYLKNPAGIDIQKPRFSWKIVSSGRGIIQTSYKISVSTAPDGENEFWNSGQVTSDASVHIEYEGPDLLPSTRYYWKVDVWDGDGQKITSNELAFFETGLKDSGWSGAYWIKNSKHSDQNPDHNPEELNKYTIEMDFEIVDVAAGPIFGAKDTGQNFFMWQINLDKSAGKTIFRPHSWQNGGAANHADKDISNIIQVQTGQTYRLRIEIDGDKASTYINNLLIDENRTNPLGGNYGYGTVGLGFRADIGENNKIPEKSYYDNILVSAEINGERETLFSEDFSSPDDHAFTFGTVENGRLLVEGRSNTNFSWQKNTSNRDTHFIITADLTLLNDNAGLIFSAKDQSNFYMWAINTHDADAPLIRRHSYTGGNPAWSQVNIGNYFSKSDLLNQQRRLKIEVIGNTIKTFIDEQLVDTYNDISAQAIVGGIGFRSYYGDNTNEIASWDNIVFTNYEDGQPVILLSEDFETENNPFDGGEITIENGNTKLRVASRNGELRIFDDSMNGIPLFRTEFNLTKEIRSARLYSSALGVYDVFINGQRIGTPTEDGKIIYDEFKPGWTDYSKTVFYTTYPVTDFLNQGQNAIGACVSSGWWTGAIAHGEYGSPSLGFIAKLLVEYTDGSSDIIVTNPETWRSTTDSPVRIGDIYAGETYDARNEKDWTNPGFDDSGWLQTTLNTDFNGNIKAFIGPPVQVRPELQRQPVKITLYEGHIETSTYGKIDTKALYEVPTVISLKKGQTVLYDLGQNMVGWVNFKVKGKYGCKMKIRFAEMLNDDGSQKRGNDGPGGSLYTINLRGAKATLHYILKGDDQGEEFHPSTTFFGFRYCDITATDDIEIESLTGEVVGTVAEEGSSFETNHAAVNQLYQNVIWGQRGNFLSIPTDCPQRDERLGWTGDIQVFGRAATYNADLAAFFHKWMGDMRDSQRSDGAYPSVAPHSWVGWGQAAWAEAGLVVPWNVYLMYNDKSILKENFESMEQYMTFLSNQAGGGYQYNGAGTDYGDWIAFVSTDSRYVSVCYYAYAALLMEKTAKALSETENDIYTQKAVSYRTLYNNIKQEFQQRYITDGRLKINTQTAYLLALRLDLFATNEARESGILKLKELITNNSYKLNTGFVGTGTLNQTLSDVGLTDIAYNLLLQRNNPSWLYSVDQGATTIWERWDSYTMETGFHNDISMNSFNHYAYGAVSEWMYRYMAGINPDENKPGFKHILLNPSPDFRKSRPNGQERITKTTAAYNSCYGIIKSAWEIDSNENVTYDVRVPANTTATLTLILNSDYDEVYENNAPVNEVEGVTSFRKEDRKAILQLQSGDYRFEVRKKEGSSLTHLPIEPEIFVYPNPVERTISFKSEREITDIRIYNDNGSLVYSQRNGLPVDMYTFASGIYFVQINKKQPKIIKVVKK
jgi:alpha-L-rhamnosidase